MPLTRKQKAFLESYRTLAGITAAARAVKINRSNHYDWLKESEEYKAAFEEVEEALTEDLEAECRRRATSGPRPSDLLLMFLLKAKRPDVYRENSKVEHSGPGGAPLSIEVKFVKP